MMLYLLTLLLHAGIFNYHLVKISESGLLKKLINKWIEDGALPSAPGLAPAASAEALGFDNLLFPSLVISLGAMGAVAVVAAEYVMGKTNKGLPGRILSGTAGRLQEGIDMTKQQQDEKGLLSSENHPTRRLPRSFEARSTGMWGNGFQY